MGEQRRPLTLEDREEISRCLAMRLTNKEIAVHAGRSESVICREIARNGGREKYRAHRAQSRADEERCRPKARKMDADPVLRGRVVSGLRGGLSPDQVAGRLKYDRSCGQAGDVVSHEAIYTWMYALPKGELGRLGVELRSGREQRKPRGRKKTPGARIVGMRSIEDRPEEVADPMPLPLGTSQVFEAVEFDSPGDVGHTWLAVPAPGEIAGLFRLAGAGPAGAVTDGELWFEDLHQEGGQREVKLVRGEKPP